jgi:hypothetical protein
MGPFVAVACRNAAKLGGLPLPSTSDRLRFLIIDQEYLAMDRRRFLAASAAAGLALPQDGAHSAEPSPTPPGSFVEPERTLTFPVDIHAASKQENASRPISRGDIKFKPYDIPVRALIAKDVDGLMLAGRCISGDFVAHASYRVTGNAVAMGEAAGVVAALAATSNRLPQDVPWDNALTMMKRIGLRG